MLCSCMVTNYVLCQPVILLPVCILCQPVMPLPVCTLCQLVIPLPVCVLCQPVKTTSCLCTLSTSTSIYSLFTAGKSEQEVLHHWNTLLLHSFGLSRERCKYTSCSHVICRHYLLPFRLRFLLPIIVDPLLAFSTVTFSTTDILRSWTIMPRERRVKSGEKDHSAYAAEGREKWGAWPARNEN